MYSIGLRVGCLILVGLVMPTSATADPIAECRAATGRQAMLEECLDRRLEESRGAMFEALGRARAAAQRVDQQSGGEMATLGIEASQNAWAAYLDTACPTWAAFVTSQAAKQTVELVCAIEQTERRVEMLLDLTTAVDR